MIKNYQKAPVLTGEYSNAEVRVIEGLYDKDCSVLRATLPLYSTFEPKRLELLEEYFNLDLPEGFFLSLINCTNLELVELVFKALSKVSGIKLGGQTLVSMLGNADETDIAYGYLWVDSKTEIDKVEAYGKLMKCIDRVDILDKIMELDLSADKLELLSLPCFDNSKVIALGKAISNMKDWKRLEDLKNYNLPIGDFISVINLVDGNTTVKDIVDLRLYQMNNINKKYLNSVLKSNSKKDVLKDLLDNIEVRKSINVVLKALTMDKTLTEIERVLEEPYPIRAARLVGYDSNLILSIRSEILYLLENVILDKSLEDISFLLEKKVSEKTVIQALELMEFGLPSQYVKELVANDALTPEKSSVYRKLYLAASEEERLLLAKGMGKTTNSASFVQSLFEVGINLKDICGYLEKAQESNILNFILKGYKFGIPHSFIKNIRFKSYKALDVMAAVKGSQNKEFWLSNLERLVEEDDT